jgi:methylase of polypeptide subunit release factors
LTLLAAQELEEKRVNIYASDLLPEAVATTRLNIQRFLDSAPPELPLIQVFPSGNLFEPVSSRQFELIIFNAPWVVSRARNRAEIAIHDEGQKTLRNFFQEAPRHLTAGGRILLGYADTSGTKAIDNLTAMVAEAGLIIANRFKKRVATHRAKRKWENIMVYELTRRM